MSSVRPVPETELMSGEQLTADDAWHTVRRFGLRQLLAASFVRFRYGDGFSHARAFGMQLALASVPLIIAGAGLATALGLGTAFVAATSAFAQLERGANRIYGTKRDRPALRKYGYARAALRDRGPGTGRRAAADRGRRAVRRGAGAGVPLG